MSTHPLFDDSRGEVGGVVSRFVIILSASESFAQVLGGGDALVDVGGVWLQCISRKLPGGGR
jgi:hypothetical protein